MAWWPSLDYISGANERIILLALVKAPAGYIVAGSRVRAHFLNQTRDGLNTTVTAFSEATYGLAELSRGEA